MVPMSISSAISLMDFTADEIPTKKWMKLIRPKFRLRVCVRNRDFVSSVVKGQATDTTVFDSISWSWSNDQRPFFSDDELFEVEVERRFLLGYKCIRRTKQVTINQIGISDHYTLSLYDGEKAVDTLDDGIVMGKIMFTLQDVSRTTIDDSSSTLARQQQPCNILVTYSSRARVVKLHSKVSPTAASALVVISTRLRG